MSSSRTKRKRTEGDPTAAMAATSRRRGRDGRSGAEPTLQSEAPKNEGETGDSSSDRSTSSPSATTLADNNTNATTATATTNATNIGEASTSTAGSNSGTVTAPQHTQTTNVTAANAPSTDNNNSAARESNHETSEEKKRENETEASTQAIASTGVAAAGSTEPNHESSEKKKRENETEASTQAIASAGVATAGSTGSPASTTTGTVSDMPMSQNIEAVKKDATALPPPPSNAAATRATMPPATENGTLPSKKKASSNNNNSREGRLKAMISHRKLLLERVKCGRTAARSRIVDVARQQAQSNSLLNNNHGIMGEPSSGNTAASSKTVVALSEKARDEAEVAALKKLSKSAQQAAKKQRVENNEIGGTHEKRSSLSLRKGASVGKNMKAALSSLVPGGASAMPSVVPSAQLPLHHSATAGNSTSVLPVQQHASAAAVPRIPGQLPLPTKKNKSGNQLPMAAARNDALSKVARIGSQKNLKTSNAAARGIPPLVPSAAELPLHAGLSAPGLPSNRLGVGPPHVVCKEAAALRGRKKAIQTKLLDHFKERGKRLLLQAENQQRGQDATSPGGTLLTTTTTDDDSKKKIVSAASLAMKAASTTAKSTSCMPRRRKTHWDNLLEEMSWMATDFLEERKWKISAARTLGSALEANQLITGGKTVKSRVPQEDTANTSASPMEVLHDDEASSKQKETRDGTGKNQPSSPTKSTKDTVSEERTVKVSPSGSYSKPTTEDANASRKVARAILSMAHEFGGALAQSAANRTHTKALVAADKEVEQDKGTGTTATTTLVADSLQAGDKDNADRAEDGASVETGDATNKSGEAATKDKASSFKQISKAVDALLEISSSKTARKTYKRGRPAGGGKGEGFHVTMTAWQVETAEFIEKKWGNSSGPGAILTAPRASGKTVAVCSLLWKRRTSGPQLLVCSPYRVMSWMHELKRCRGLRVKSFGNRNANADIAFEPGDVVVYEHSALKSFEQSDFSRFETLVIDCRYPCGFQGSRRPSIFDGGVPGNPAKATNFPAELISEPWWEHLVESSANSSLQRLVIEHPLQAALLASAAEKSEMQRVELIALRAAFLLGANIFASRTSSVKKRILTWARRKMKDSVAMTTNKIKAVQDFLVELVEPFCCPQKSDNLLELASHTEGKRFDIETRPCILSEIERHDYEKCCWALRGALSYNINEGPECEDLRNRSLSAISDALLKLRRQCIHPEMTAILTSASVRVRLGPYASLTADGAVASGDNRILSRKIKDSPSQTDSDLACRILRGSAKFRELVSMLRDDCDYYVEGDDNLLDEFLGPEKGKRSKQANDRNSTKTPKKVVILAMLPEVQIILSVLLNCVGIHHELLLRPSILFSLSASDESLGLPEKQTDASILAWVECQQALARFNTPPSSSSSCSTNLVIASPDMVASDHGGIGIEMAGMIISVDEDWSGRYELIMRSLVADLIPPNLRTKDKGCEFVRLVCENTCEENFLSADSEDNPGQSADPSDSDAWPWRIDSFGRFDSVDRSSGKAASAQTWPWRQQDEDIFAFPAFNLMRFRNQELSEVLSIEDGLPPLLGDGSPVLFLPKSMEGESATDSAGEIQLVVRMMETEENTGVRSLPPSSFPCGAVIRQDLSTAAIRLYLEHFGKSPVLKQLHPSSAQPMAAGGTATSSIPASSEPQVASDMSDTWQAHGDGGIDAVDFASSLLFYSPPARETGEKSEQDTRTDRDAATLVSAAGPRRSRPSPGRSNKYVDAFNLFLETAVRDGKQGSEALVYFPPLFPRLQQCSLQAQRDIDAIRTRKSISQEKRPADTSEDPLAKRLKVDDLAASVGSSSVPQPVNAISFLPAVAPLIREDEASHSDAATVLLDLDEDFGLIGVGAIALPKESAVASAAEFVESTSHFADPDRISLQSDWSNDLTPADLEELDTFSASRSGHSLGSVILFVARKPRQRLPLATAAPVYRPTAPMPGVLPGLGNGAVQDMNGVGTPAKKSKKKAPMPLNPAVGVPVPHPVSQMPINVQMVKAKDMYRSKILSFLSSRQKALGMTMFESSAYCVAAVRFRNRISDRMPHQDLASAKIASVLPVLGNGAFSWTSIVKRLKNTDSTTGDDARALAESQQSVLRRSLSAPGRVDFGPFQGGFLPSVSSMTGMSPPRSRIGVSLPMGVKIPVGTQQQLQLAWNDAEDQKLQDCMTRFGMNWILAARMLTGFDDVVISSVSSRAAALDRCTIAGNSHQQRSARSCRDRWQSLARVDPLLAIEARKSDYAVIPERARDATRLSAAKLDKADSPAISTNTWQPTSFLFSSQSIAASAAKPNVDNSSSMHIGVADSSGMPKLDGDSTNEMDIDKPKKTKKNYGMLMAARSKVHIIPMIIPGVAPGSQPSFVPSHPSHAQSVQSSVAAAWTNGRTEMWPLQFLDVAEKQRAAQAASTAAAVATSSPPAATGGKRISSTTSSARSRGALTNAAPVASRPHQSKGQAYASPPNQAPPHRASPYHPPAGAPHPLPSRSPHHHHPHPQQQQQRMAQSPPSRTPVPQSSVPRPSAPRPALPHPRVSHPTTPHAATPVAAGQPPSYAHTPIAHSQELQQQLNAAKPQAAPASAARLSPSTNKSPPKKSPPPAK